MKKPKFQNNAVQRTLREKKELMSWMNQHSKTWLVSLNEYPKERLVHEERNKN